MATCQSAFATMVSAATVQRVKTSMSAQRTRATATPAVAILTDHSNVTAEKDMSATACVATTRMSVRLPRAIRMQPVPTRLALTAANARQALMATAEPAWSTTTAPRTHAFMGRARVHSAATLVTALPLTTTARTARITLTTARPTRVSMAKRAVT